MSLIYGRVSTNYIHNFLGRLPRNKNEVTGAYLISLPFRIDLGRLSKFEYSNKTEEFDVWIYNKLSSNTRSDETRNSIDYASKILVHCRKLHLNEMGFKVLLQSVKDNDPITTAMFDNERSVLLSVAKVINKVLAACNAVNEALITGNIVKAIDELDLTSERLCYADITIISPEDAHLSEGEAERIITKYAATLKLRSWSFISRSFFGDIEQVKKVFVNLDRLLYFELLFEARAKAEQLDFKGALIQTVIALDHLMWLILDIFLGDKIQTVKQNLRSKEEQTILSNNKVNRLIEELSRVLGTTLLVQTIPYLFFSDSQRPTPSKIDDAVKAISFRNKLIHSKKTPSGKYYWQTAETDVASKHYRKLYEFTYLLGVHVKNHVWEHNNV